MKQKIVLSTNKLLYDMFNFEFTDEDIKQSIDYIDKEKKDIYYVEFNYESSKDSTFKVKISSTERDCLRFTIYEKMILLILISNVRQSSSDNYFISMRKIKSIRGLKDNSSNTYNCYKMAIDRLKNKKIMLIPLKVSKNYSAKFINCNILTISNEVYVKSRIAEFNYSFNDLNSSLVKNSQKITTYYNPFSFIFKKYFSFQICLHIFRLIALNRTATVMGKEFSYQLMLKHIHKVDSKGFIENTTYYDYVVGAGNKQSELLKKSYDELEIILKQFVKYEIIKSFSISKRRTFKYLKDDEVKIGIKFIR